MYILFAISYNTYFMCSYQVVNDVCPALLQPTSLPKDYPNIEDFDSWGG